MASPLHRRQKRQTNTSLYFHAPKSTLTSRRSPKSLPPASPSVCSKVCLTSCALSVGREACLLQPVCHSHLHLTVKLTSSTRKSNERQQLSRLNREDLRLQSVWFHRRADFSSPFFEGDSKTKMFFARICRPCPQESPHAISMKNAIVNKERSGGLDPFSAICGGGHFGLYRPQMR